MHPSIIIDKDGKCGMLWVRVPRRKSAPNLVRRTASGSHTSVHIVGTVLTRSPNNTSSIHRQQRQQAVCWPWAEPVSMGVSMTSKANPQISSYLENLNHFQDFSFPVVLEFPFFPSLFRHDVFIVSLGQNVANARQVSTRLLHVAKYAIFPENYSSCRLTTISKQFLCQPNV